MWTGAISYRLTGATSVPTAMIPYSFVKRNTQLSEKLTRIKQLVVSGRYQMNAEKIAEKMLGTMAGLLMAS